MRLAAARAQQAQVLNAQLQAQAAAQAHANRASMLAGAVMGILPCGRCTTCYCCSLLAGLDEHRLVRCILYMRAQQMEYMAKSSVFEAYRLH